MPVSRPSVSLTRYGVKYASKNARTEASSAGAAALALAQTSRQVAAVAARAIRTGQPAINAGHAADKVSVAHPGRSLKVVACRRALEDSRVAPSAGIRGATAHDPASAAIAIAPA